VRPGGTDPLRIGVLGAASITPAALLGPAAEVDAIEVVSIAARDRSRAEEFAAEHGIPEVDPTYDALLARTDLDAVYLPLPAHLHADWTLRALDAGKHVLCEKPMAMDAREAVEVTEAARASGLILMEGFHYRYHPLIERAVSISRSGGLGRIEELRIAVDWPANPAQAVYWDRALGGGNLRHAGCYAIHLARTVMGGEPVVLSAHAEWARGVDTAIVVELGFPGGVRAHISSSMTSERIDFGATVRGSLGELSLDNFIGPHAATLTVDTEDGRTSETFGPPSSFVSQLIAFADAVATGIPPLTSGADLVGNAAAIDAILECAEKMPPPG
jgi:predicted dehydrogenase